MKPLITLIKQKEKFYETAHSVHIEGRNTMVSAWQSQTLSLVAQISILSLLVGDFRAAPREGMPMPVRRKKAISAFIPAIASLAKIAVESLSTFLQ